MEILIEALILLVFVIVYFLGLLIIPKYQKRIKTLEIFFSGSSFFLFAWPLSIGTILLTFAYFYARNLKHGSFKHQKQEVWKIRGLDTFSGEPYPLPGEYSTEEEAIEAAQKRIDELEKTQPTKSSGGQGFYGIQDRVFIIRPDGTEYRYNRKQSENNSHGQTLKALFYFRAA